MSHGRTARRRGASRGSRAKRPLPAAARRVPALALTGAVLAWSAAPAAAAPARLAAVQAPSAVLCSGWLNCTYHGYNSHGYASRGYVSYWNMSPGDECTNYVAYVESVVLGALAPDWLLGNAGQWAASAAAHGVPVNHVPAVGAVAEWNGGAYGMGPLGHVAVVERVGPRDRYIDISQQNIGSDIDGYDWTRIDAGFPATEWQEWPDNFIHFPRNGLAGRPGSRYRFGPPGMNPQAGAWLS
jgi:surface antigen